MVSGMDKGNWAKDAATALGVAAITLLVFLPALQCGFVNLDDPDYVLNNPLLQLPPGDTLVSAFNRTHAGWWMPLTWLSLACDRAIWGFNPFGFHLTNIILHAVNAGLVTILAARLCRPFCTVLEGEEAADSPICRWALPLLAGLLFSIHPLRVESVAWVTERKDVLNGLFTIAALLAYLCGRERGAGTVALRIISIVLFACSLMAKSVSVVFPLLLLLVDWYPLGRFERERAMAIIAEKTPYFALSAAMVIVTLMTAAGSGYLVPLDIFPFHQRLLVSGTAVVEYCRLLILPVGISPMFMVPDPIPVSYKIMAVMSGLLCVAVVAARKWRWIPALWLSLLLPLLPVLAFFQNGDQAYAARFTYLPSIGPAIGAASLFAVLYRRVAGSAMGRPLLVCVMAFVIAAYGATTARSTGFWRDSGTLWTRAIAIEPTAQSYKERGVFYYQSGDFARSVEDFTSAIKLLPKVWRPYAHNLYAHRGEALRAAGRYGEALRDFSEAIRRYPHPSYYRFRGDTLIAMGRTEEGEADHLLAGPGNWKIGWYWEQGVE